MNNFKFSFISIILYWAIFCQILSSHADDTDIYLKSTSKAEHTPYFMFMVDTSSEMFVPFCIDFKQCVPKMTENAFAQLCVDYGFSENSSFSTLDKESVCRAWFIDFDKDKKIDNSELFNPAKPENHLITKGPAEGFNKLQVFTANVAAILQDLEGINVGLMAVSHNAVLNGDENGIENERYLLQPYRLLTNDNIETKNAILKSLKSLEIPKNNNAFDKSYSTEMFNELLRYLNGEEMNLPSPFANNSPTASCTKLFAVDFTFHPAQKSDELTKLLSIFSAKETDLVKNTLISGIQNMSISIVTDSQHLEQSVLMSVAGGTSDVTLNIDSGRDFEPALRKLFSKALTKSSSFVASTVPLNVYNKSHTLDDFFVAMFEVSKTERWPGNIKKLALLDIDYPLDGTDEIIDFTHWQSLQGKEKNATFLSAQALSSEDGRIKNNALTFWTDATTMRSPVDGELVEKDGQSVTRGGAGQKIPGFLTNTISTSNSAKSRQIFTNDIESENGILPLNATIEVGEKTYIDFDFNSTQINWLEKITKILPSDRDHNAKLASAMIQYVRGIDINHENYGFSSNNPPVRDWILGDVIHSKPLAINYGNIQDSASNQYLTRSNPYVSIVVGANDGMLHFLQNTGNDATYNAKDNDNSDYPEETGTEVFAFIPRELLKIIPALAKNDGSYINPFSTGNHPYGMDGQVTSLIFDDTTNPENTRSTVDIRRVGIADGVGGFCDSCNDFVYIYAPMRRGGKSIYHLDVTDPFNPPIFKGMITKGGDFSELGLTFSRAIPVVVKYDKYVVPALVFAGGYDNRAYDDYGSVDKNQNYNHYQAINRKVTSAFTYIDDFGVSKTVPAGGLEGNSIYIVNALDRSLIWKSTYGTRKGSVNNQLYNDPEMSYSIPSSITVLDTNNDGFMDRLYVGDIAGNIWRGDFPTCTSGSCSTFRRDNWAINKIAELGSVDIAGTSAQEKGKYDIRFFHEPAVAASKDSNGNFLSIVIGSGDRENPLESRDENWMFMIKDRMTTLDASSSGAKVIYLNDLSNLSDCESTSSQCEVNKNGWKYRIGSPGEKVLSTPLIAKGVIYATTYNPKDITETCEPSEGVARLYQANLKDGTVVNNNESHFEDISTGIVGDVIVAGDDIIFPATVPVDFLQKGSEDNVRLKDRQSTFDTDLNRTFSTYWIEKNVDVIK